MKMRRVLISIGIVIALLAFGVFALRYRRYIYAAAWHGIHSNDVKFGVYQIDIPKLWWLDKIDNTGRISILRASKASAFLEPEIELNPIKSGAIAENDTEELHITQEFVSEEKLHPLLGWTYSWVSLKAHDSIWYCTKKDLVILGNDFSTNLNCSAARIPYFLYYQGPSEQEREAELIFTSFR